MGAFSKQQLSPLQSFLPIEGNNPDFKNYAQGLEGKKNEKDMAIHLFTNPSGRERRKGTVKVP